MEASSPKDFFQPILHDLMSLLSNPETQSFMEKQVLQPVLRRIFQELYPYILGVMTLWVVMFLCVALILILLVRGSILDNIFVIRK